MPAANIQPGTSGRGFVPGYTVKYRGSQKAEDRFGVGCREDISDMLDDHENEPYPQNFSGQWEDFPRLARVRMNLTALSQHRDLYFVAYLGFVHVYRLGRGIRVALGEPEAILNPSNSKTETSKYVSAAITPGCPDAINHMIVGELGDQEILVVCRDNGDVEAWYTATIAQYIQRNKRMRENRDQTTGGEQRGDRVQRQPHPRHFFAENVGASAWGLAVHKKSRLIAVSSNSHEVTVFALALNGDKQTVNEASADRVDILSKDAGHTDIPKSNIDISNTPSHGGEGRVTMELQQTVPNLIAFRENGPAGKGTNVNGQENVRYIVTKVGGATKQIDTLQKRLQARRRTWRIVLSFGVEASNMPSVAICDDAEGNGSRIAAIDINGYLYVADIWKVARKPIRIPPHNVQFPSGRRSRFVRGWNVLPVMDLHLLPTDKVHAALGLHPDKCVHRAKTSRGAWQDISKCMPEIRYDAASRRHKHRIAVFDAEDRSENTDGLARDNFSLVDFEEAANISPYLSEDIWRPVYDPNDGTGLENRGPMCLAMTIVPFSGNHFPELTSPRALAEFAGVRGAAKRAHELRVPLSTSQFRQNAQMMNGEDLLRDISFLRFNEEDMEMFALNETDTGVVCHHVLDNVNTNTNDAPWDMGLGKRCSMLLTIPELHLVIMGSMCGRVALLTLTKPPPAENTPRRAFRVDAVLPFQYEEETSERPYVCLLGIAVSPMPESRSRGLELRRRRQVGKGGTRSIEPEPPRRWRLILNYQDHTVMQYDIVKRDQGETASWDDFAGSKVYSRRRYKTEDSDTEDNDSDSWADTSEDEDITVGMDHDPHEHMVAEDVMDAMLDDLAQEEFEGGFGAVADDGQEIDFPDMQIA